MKYTNLFDLASDVFEKTGVPAILIGGFAVNYHGMTRDTQDVDFLMVEEDYEKAKPILEAAACQEQLRNNLFARLETKDAGFMPLDLVFVDRKTFEEILKKAETAEIDGKKFKVPSLTHLLALKLHAMKQDLRRRGFRDLTDVLDLAEKNGIDVQSKDFQKLCRDYAGEKVYETIRELLRKWKS